MAEKDDKEPDEKPAVTFKTEGAFLAEVEKKSKKLVEKAVAQAKAALLAEIGVDEGDDVAEFKAKLESSKKARTEVDTAQAEIKKLAGKLKEADKELGELRGFKDRAQRTDALKPFAKMFRDPEDMEAHLGGKLVIGEDGKASGPDGVALDKWVGSFLEAKPHLRAPDFKPGTGTSKVHGKTEPAAGASNGEDKDKKPMGLAEMALAIHEGRIQVDGS